MSKFGIAYLLAYATSMCGTFFVDISWGIYMYILQYWLNPQTRWWYGQLPDVRWSFVIAICILMAYITKIGNYAKNRLFAVPQTKWLIMNLIMIILISNWAVWPQMHSKFRTDHIKLLVFMTIAYKCIDTAAKFEGMMWVHMTGAFYVAYETKKQGRNSQGRVEGTGPADSGGDGNQAAASLISVLPILVYYTVRNHLLKSEIWKRLLLLLFLAYILNAVVLINSRGSFIGLTVSFVYMGGYIFLNKNVTMKQRFQMIALVILGVCIFLYLADDTFWERMGSISEESESDTGGGGRVLFWKIAWEMTKIYPFGVGGWGFAYLSPQYVPPEFLTNGMRAEHSLYFQCLIERGYIGFLIWTGLILSNFRFMAKIKNFLRQKEELTGYFLALAIESGFIAFLTAAAFLNRLNCEILYWFPLFFGCIGNIYMIQIKQSEELYNTNE